MAVDSGKRRHDLVVVGAGFAGLTAARRLAEAGLAVAVVEARDRVGGRVESRTLADGHTIDVGGQWTGPGQTRLRALAGELGIRTFRQFDTGRKLLSMGGRVSSYRRTIPSLPVWSLVELQAAIAKIGRRARAVPLAAPATARRAAEWDDMTLETWKRKHLRSARARTAFDFAVRSIFAAEPGELSFLHALFYLHAGGGLMKLASVDGGAQQERFHGGAQPVAEGLAAAAVAAGAELRLQSPVRAISHGEGGCVLHSDTGEFAARRVVLAVPPPLAGRIRYDPALPAPRDALTQRMPMGSVIKVVAAFERPFWRERGLSGELLSDQGPVGLAFDDSSEDGSRAALVGFMLGARAREWTGRSAEERREAVLQSFAGHFGPEALEPVDVVEKDWLADEWSRGCYAAFMTPGTMTSLGHALRRPCGCIHWAGTETAEEWNGYIEGAIRSGERAAGEVLSLVGGRG